VAFSNGWSSVLAGSADTIAACASPPGRGALAVIRVSGPGALAVGARVAPGLRTDRPWRAQLVELHGPAAEPVDRGIVIPYHAPSSSTGEDMVELMVHAAPAVIRIVLESCEAAGARPARPGEFTRRAVANGKMDLLQAEAVAELVHAETAWELRVARSQVDGELSRRVGVLREGLTALLARLEAALDFAEQGVAVDLDALERERAALVEAMGRLRSSVRSWERLRRGVRVVLLGPPNSGKSTLFNTLVGMERAIVSPHPGTTRDLVEAEVELGGVRVTLVDTAGVREGGDAVEAEGVRRATEAAADADVLVVLRAVDGETREAGEPTAGVPWIGVVTKSDLDPGVVPPEGWVAVSARDGTGMEELEERLRGMVSGDVEPDAVSVVVNRRHAAALESAAASVEGAPLDEPELAAEDLREAVRHLDELMGRVATDDVLDSIFETFCLGK